MQLLTKFDVTDKNMLKLMDKGWEFWDEDWEDGHNGNLHHTFHFQSPRMGNETTSYAYSFRTKQLVLKQLLKDEARFLAHNHDGQLASLMAKTIDKLTDNIMEQYMKEDKPKIKLPKKLI